MENWSNLRGMQRVSIASTQKYNHKIMLDEPQKHYLCRVLRLGKGDRFIAIDGRGKSWLAELTASTSAHIIEALVQDTELGVEVTLMVALPKGNGFDNIVRCCTELGASSFVTVGSDHTLLKPSAHKLSRWRKIATEAAEQSERQIVPEVTATTDFSTACNPAREATPLTPLRRGVYAPNRYICVGRGGAPHLLHRLENRLSGNIIIATGPEGGWSEGEIEIGCASGFQPVSLGKRILRSITAPIFAMSLVAATLEKE